MLRVDLDTRARPHLDTRTHPHLDTHTHPHLDTRTHPHSDTRAEANLSRAGCDRPERVEPAVLQQRPGAPADDPVAGFWHRRARHGVRLRVPHRAFFPVESLLRFIVPFISRHRRARARFQATQESLARLTVNAFVSDLARLTVNAF
eukprot:768752-Prorocentrum_minimum.AAC.2